MLILKGHNSAKPVRSLAFSPDGVHLGSSARDYQTRLWNLTTGSSLVIEPGYADSYTVAFSPDGAVIATGKTRGFSLYTIATGRLRSVESSENPAWQLGFLRDGRLLAGAGRHVALWDAETLHSIPLGERAQMAHGCLAVSPDGKWFATSHLFWRATRKEHWVQLWDVASLKSTADLPGATAEIEALSFSPDSRLLAMVGGRKLLVWNVADGRVVHEQAHGKQNYKDVAFSPDGRWLAFANNDATIRLLDVRTWHEAAGFDWKLGSMISVAFAPDGMRAAGGSGRGKIVVWDVDL
jgi:WD40 repeat protein